MSRLVILILALLATTAAAETVSVKYRGPVDLAPFTCTATQSSFVHRVCYDAKRANLILLLNTTYYAYCGVPVETHSALIRSSSKGRFFNSYIKNRFRC